MKQKKSLKILIAIVLLIIFVAFVIIDRIIIIRIRYDEGSFDGHYVDYPNDERLYILKGYGRDSEPYPCTGFKMNVKNGQVFLGLNIFNWDDMSLNGAGGYFIYDVCEVDGQRIAMYYDLYYPKSKVHFWDVNLHVSFEENQDGELQYNLEYNNASVEFKKDGQFCFGAVYR